jgi:23S rRNA pseudouridine2605 synthase
MKDQAKAAAKAPAKAKRAQKRTKSAGESAAKSPAASAKRAAGPATSRAAAKTGAATAKAKKAGKAAGDEAAVNRGAKTAGTPAGMEETVAKTKRAAKRKDEGAKAQRETAEAKQTGWYRAGDAFLDPIGDVTSGEARTYLGDGMREIKREGQAATEMDAFRKETAIEASDAMLEAGPGMEAAQEALEEHARKEAEDTAAEEDAKEQDDAETAEEFGEPARPGAAKRERLQKILSRAGIASRRRAEEMIAAGRVMVNGQVVTQLGSKADPARDHIRVDGKLLQGAERHRYFVLNKPKGYVTTASDPEGRPTVTEFFAKMRERLYPVGRLDFQSEGLLLMTNDGELANLLTKAGSGVEKTYLVKVAGQPTAEQLERLREGVRIEKGEHGSERVQTAPARLREVRRGENPWFEVVLIEGRNRELRKMFAAIGHYAEKIRRVGYGPLALDVEPGQFRELTTGEVNALRLTAEGKAQPRRMRAERLLPKEAGVPAEQREERRGGRGGRSFDRGGARQSGRRDGGGRAAGRPQFRGGQRPEHGEKRFDEKPRFEDRQRGGFKPRGDRPQWKRDAGAGSRGERAGFRGGPRREFGGDERRERGERSFGEAQRRPFKPRGDRPQWKRAGEAGQRGELKPRGEFKPRIEGQRSEGFGGKPKFGSGGKPRFGGDKAKRAFGRKAGFGGKPGFGSKPGGRGNFRGSSAGGGRFGGGKPGAARGGWKRG